MYKSHYECLDGLSAMITVDLSTSTKEYVVSVD